MPRENRVILEGAIYHRGNNREHIFENSRHKPFLIKQIKEYNEVYDFQLLAYVIMDNHYHLLIKTNKTPISEIMFSINNVLGKYLNRELKKSGHAFESRFKSRLFNCAGTARFAFNWALAFEKDNYAKGGPFLSDGDLRKKLTELKKTDEFKWLNEYSNNITKQAVKDACAAYYKFFKKQCSFPNFKSRKKSKPSFYIDTDKIQFSQTHVKLEKLTTGRKENKQKLNWIKVAENDRIPIEGKYVNPRVTFDGMNWWISVGIEIDDNIKVPENDGIGIDLGLKNLAVCSDENTYENINRTTEIRKLIKRKRRLQRRISRKYLINKKGDSYCKTSNIIKSEKELLKLNHRLTGIRHNYLHQITSEIIRREPSFIVLEDFNVAGMMKNKHLAKAIQEQGFYEFYRQLKYKAAWNNIKFIEAPRFYPSSKLCCACGSIKNDLKLKDRTYHCSCGNVIDRDYQASVNLYNYGKGIA